MIQRITANTSLDTTEKIVEIHKQCISQANKDKQKPETIQKWLSQISVGNTINQFDIFNWIVLEKNNQIVGFAQYSLTEGEINQFQIIPDKQRSGYGKELYEYIEEDFKKNNKKIIKLDSVTKAFKFYKTMGFKKQSIFPLITRKTELVTMVKNLE